MTDSITLQSIAFRPKIKAPMQLKQQAMVTRVAGIEGDARGKPGKRQVTLLSEEQWQLACDVINIQLPWTIRRANLLLKGLQCDSSLVGKQIKIGALILLVTGETDPCSKMDAQVMGLMQALTPDWRGGICCKVIADGRITIDDKVHIV